MAMQHHVTDEQEHSKQDGATGLCLAFVTPQQEHGTEFRLLYSNKKAQ